MLACACFGYNPGFPHAFCQKPLTEGIINFMGACVQKVFSLQVNPCASQPFA